MIVGAIDSISYMDQIIIMLNEIERLKAKANSRDSVNSHRLIEAHTIDESEANADYLKK